MNNWYEEITHNGKRCLPCPCGETEHIVMARLGNMADVFCQHCGRLAYRSVYLFEWSCDSPIDVWNESVERNLFGQLRSWDKC